MLSQVRYLWRFVLALLSLQRCHSKKLLWNRRQRIHWLCIGKQKYVNDSIFFTITCVLFYYYGSNSNNLSFLAWKVRHNHAWPDQMEQHCLIFKLLSCNQKDPCYFHVTGDCFVLINCDIASNIHLRGTRHQYYLWSYYIREIQF